MKILKENEYWKIREFIENSCHGVGSKNVVRNWSCGWDGIWQRKTWETTNDGKNRTTNSRKTHKPRRKGNLQVLGNFGSGHHQTSGDKRKN